MKELPKKHAQEATAEVMMGRSKNLQRLEVRTEGRSDGGRG